MDKYCNTVVPWAKALGSEDMLCLRSREWFTQEPVHPRANVFGKFSESLLKPLWAVCGWEVL